MFDAVVVGAGPGGSSAAAYMAASGLSVLLCDRARFPRDKPCGDGVTPRGVRLLHDLGLANDLASRFHRVDRVRVNLPHGNFERGWPDRGPDFPDHGYVCSRRELDQLLLEHAANLGSEVLEGVRVTHPIERGGRVGGVAIEDSSGRSHEVQAQITICADGATSPVGKQLGFPKRGRRGVVAYAVRAEVNTCVDRADALHVFPELRIDNRLVPGYGWVFPMGDSRINVGVGYINRGLAPPKMNDLFEAVRHQAREEFAIPTVESLRATKQLRGWKLPMGLTVWPPSRPGAMVVGDALGAAKPFTGAGISKALQSGRLASEVALEALSQGSPGDLQAYDDGIAALWRPYYDLGNLFVRSLALPAAMNAFLWSVRRSRVARNFWAAAFSASEDGLLSAVAAAIRGDADAPPQPSEWS